MQLSRISHARATLKGGLRLFAVAAATLALVGCAGSTNGGTTAEPTAPPGVPQPPVNLESYECSVEVPCVISFRWWGGDDRQQRTLDAIALFEEQNPHIRVNPLPVSFAGYYEQLAIEFVAGTGPDVFQIDAARPTEFGRQGLLLPLDGMVDTTYLPAAQVEEASVNGVLYAAPHTGNAQSLLINADLFAEAGVPLPDDDTWTWDDFVRIGGELRDNLPAGQYALELIPANMVRAWLAQQYQGGLFGADGDIAAPPELVAEFFDFTNQLVQEGITPAPAVTQQYLLAGLSESLVGTNRAAMIFWPSNAIGQLVAASEADIRLVRLPGESSETYVGTNVDVGLYYAASANTHYPEAAGRFINFLVNSPEAGLYFGVERGIPLNSQVAAALAPTVDAVAQQQFDYLDRVFAANGFAYPRAPGGDLHVFINRAFEGVIFGQLSSQAGADQFIADIQEGIDHARHGIE